jgi:ribosomal subunit interface protein
VDVQITFRDMHPTAAVSDVIREKAASLEKFYDRMTRCHVTVETPHKHRHKGRIHHVHIQLHMPGHEIAINHEAGRIEHEDVYVALRDAFLAAERQVKDHASRMRKDHRQV